MQENTNYSLEYWKPDAPYMVLAELADISTNF